jgi:hypothetical protein
MWSAADGLAKCNCGDGKFWDSECKACPSGAKCDGVEVISCDSAAFAVASNKKSCEEKCTSGANGEALTWSGSACLCDGAKPLKSGSAGDTKCAACDPATNVTTGAD